MANIVLKGLDLPIDRLPNLLYDMNMYRTFEQKVTNPEIIMRQDIRHTQHPSTHYASLPKYILIHKSLGIETKPSSDINWLLNEFSTVLKKS